MSNSIRTIKFRSGRELSLGNKTLVMGILNVTPDSFSDGGLWFNSDDAARHVREMIDDGADIIDIGAESTRPSAIPIGAEEELARLEKILRVVRDCPVPISVDTYKASVAAAAIDLGADFINCVHCDRSMLETAARLDVPIVVAHDQPSDVAGFFARMNALAREVGLARRNLIFDPGIGFGKSQQTNLMIIRQLEKFRKYRPLMLAVSRKSVIEYALGLPVDQRDEATAAWCVLGAAKGVDIVRVHNVKLVASMLRAADVLLRG